MACVPVLSVLKIYGIYACCACVIKIYGAPRTSAYDLSSNIYMIREFRPWFRSSFFLQQPPLVYWVSAPPPFPVVFEYPIVFISIL
jgi:hypothetical protein